jgi:hypothetical protein
MLSRSSAGACVRLSGTPETPLDDVAVLAFNGYQAGVEQFSLRDDDEVEPWRDLVPTKNLSYKSFRSISLYGAAEPPRGGDTQPADLLPRCPYEHGRQAPMGARAVGIDLLKLGATSDAFRRPETCHAANARLARAALNRG